MKETEGAMIPNTLRRQWIACCRQRLPYETCGIVLGHCRDDRLHIDGFTVIRNMAIRPEHSFSFEPAEWVRAWYEAERSGKSVVGVFHSHPDGTIDPSAADGDGRLNWGTYWIVGLSDEEARIAGYRAGLKAQWHPLELAYT